MDEEEVRIQQLRDQLAEAEQRRTERLVGTTLGSPSRARIANASTTPILVALGIGACLGLVALGLLPNLMHSSPYSGEAEYSWMPPGGYDLERTSNGVAVGTQWFRPEEDDCPHRGKCWGLLVITERECPRNLYVSISLLDEAGSNVGWTNDTAQGVRPMEPARLIFRSYERSAATGRIAQMSCY